MPVIAGTRLSFGVRRALLILTLPLALLQNACDTSRPIPYDAAQPTDDTAQVTDTAKHPAPDVAPTTYRVYLSLSPETLCFSFELPVGFIDVTGRCTDSLCRRYEWGDRQVIVDFGAFENTTGESEEISSEQLLVDGLSMTLQVMRLESSYYFSLRYYATRLKLTIYLRTQALTDREMALEIFKSIEGIAATMNKQQCVLNR